MSSFKVIDLNNWNRKSIFEYFKGFANPCYGFDVEIDITNFLADSKRRGSRFYVDFLYLSCLALNQIDELRMRYVKGEVRVYDVCNPNFTVLTDQETFEAGSTKMSFNYKEFYDAVSKEIDFHKHPLNYEHSAFDDDKNYDEFYFTCIPWIKYETMNHPIPDKDPESQSVPRICWGKYFEKEGKTKILYNITVSHTLCDGYALSKAFLKLQEVVDNYNDYIK